MREVDHRDTPPNMHHILTRLTVILLTIAGGLWAGVVFAGWGDWAGGPTTLALLAGILAGGGALATRS